MPLTSLGYLYIDILTKVLLSRVRLLVSTLSFILRHELTVVELTSHLGKAHTRKKVTNILHGRHCMESVMTFTVKLYNLGDTQMTRQRYVPMWV